MYTPINRIVRRAHQTESGIVSHARYYLYFGDRLGQLTFWNAPMRVIRNRVVREWTGNDAKTPPQPDPPQSIGKTILGGREYLMPKFAAILPTPETTGDFEEMCLAAGESASLVTKIGSAQAIVQTIAKEAEQILEQQRTAVGSIHPK
jgi:NAD(P)H-dependent flavin oxidoreductase YrpB (nitropropane dioxygenase family)